MKKNDFIFMITIIVIAVILIAMTQGLNTEGAFITVSVNGKEKTAYSLKKQADLTLSGTDGGINRLVIADGKAKIVEADCPDGLCVKQKAISKNGESIICLPHRLVLTVTASEKSVYDSIAN